MKGHNNDIAETPNGIRREINSGLALVTPCFLLDELLKSKTAIKQREVIARRE